MIELIKGFFFGTKKRVYVFDPLKENMFLRSIVRNQTAEIAKLNLKINALCTSTSQ